MEAYRSKLSPVLHSAIAADNTSSRNKVEKPLPVSCFLYDSETLCYTFSKSWASIFPSPEIDYPLAP